MISRTTKRILAAVEIGHDQVLEVIELAFWHENGRARGFFIMANIQQLDSLVLLSQALEGQLQIGEALEFDLQSQTLFHPGVPLGIARRFGNLAKRVQLPLESRSVASPIACRNVGTVPTTWVPIRFGVRYAFEKEVPIPPIVSVRHCGDRAPTTRLAPPACR